MKKDKPKDSLEMAATNFIKEHSASHPKGETILPPPSSRNPHTRKKEVAEPFLVFPSYHPSFEELHTPIEGEFFHSHLDEENKPITVHHSGIALFKLQRGSLFWFRVKCQCQFCFKMRATGFLFDILGSLFMDPQDTKRTLVDLPIDVSDIPPNSLEIPDEDAPFPLSKKASGRYSIIVPRAESIRDSAQVETKKEVPIVRMTNTRLVSQRLLDQMLKHTKKEKKR